MRGFPILLLPLLLLAGCASQRSSRQAPPLWGETVTQEVNALGIQNWIIVAESSFPVVSRRGVRTVMVDAEIPELVDYVVDTLEQSETVNPSFSTARELPFVKNDRAPGIAHFRGLLKQALQGREVREMDHRSLNLLAHSDAAKYAVLVLKTKTALPYSSVFIELDSGYWDRESEDALRDKMRAQQQKIQSSEANN